MSDVIQKNGRFYTHETFSRLLISNINIKNPLSIVDLGVGEGALYTAAIKKWENANFYLADNDKRKLNNLIKLYPNYNYFHFDLFSKKFIDFIDKYGTSFEVGICNPPFLSIRSNKYIKEIFYRSNLEKTFQKSPLTSYLVFLAGNLLLLKKQGQLGIILPDSMLTRCDYKAFREDLLNNYDIKTIIELPDKIFSKTEAKTHILIIESDNNCSTEIGVVSSNLIGNLSEPIMINKNKLIDRMDYSYHSFFSNKTSSDLVSFKDLGVEIIRGRQSKIELENQRIKFFHTTNFKKKILTLINSKVKATPQTRKGDVLIARVGKRSIGKVALVHSGNQVISDCVFILRVKSKNRRIIWKYLNSIEGYKSLKALSHGVCSKVISKQHLYALRIKLP